MNHESSYLIFIALILLSTKFFGVISQKVHMPQVVGALLAGVILGPSFLHLVNESDFLNKSSTIGVIILMFIAGLDTDIKELKKTGLASLVISIIGIIIPLLGGFFAYTFFFGPIVNTEEFLKAVFMGVILISTSVSITVETLREMGKMKGKVGTAILGAALIDDIIGVIVLTFVLSFKDPNLHISSLIIKVILFFVLLLIIWYVINHFSKRINNYDNMRRTAVYALAFCFIMAYVAQEVFLMSDIAGAYFAGIIFCNIGVKEYIAKKVTVISYVYFAPIFFASIGLKTSFYGISSSIIIFSIIILIVSVFTKILGCYIGAILCKFNRAQAIAIGAGMVSRGEVTLIMAEKGSKVGLINPQLIPCVLVVVVFTTLLTPILIKFFMSKKLEDN